MPISSGFELYFPSVRPENNNLARTAGNSSDVRYRHLGGLRGGGNPPRCIRRSCKDQFIVVSAGENFAHVGIARGKTGLHVDGERDGIGFYGRRNSRRPADVDKIGGQPVRDIRHRGCKTA